MAGRKFVNNINIENAVIFWKNFSGRASQYNAEGSRNFCVEIDPSMVDVLRDDGWNIKFSKPRDEEDEPRPYLQVKVKYGYKPPKIYMVTSRKKTPLDEQTVGELDRAEIVNVDLIISPSHWEVGGKSGIAAYVDTMYVTIHEDDFAKKYADIGEDEEEIPFN